jgi:hypothetical protein
MVRIDMLGMARSHHSLEYYNDLKKHATYNLEVKMMRFTAVTEHLSERWKVECQSERILKMTKPKVVVAHYRFTCDQASANAV